VLKALEGFGLSRVESEVYVYLAKIGPSTAKALSSGLGITKQQLYTTLSSLKKKGIISKKSERTVLFSALTFEEFLNHFMKLDSEKVKTIKEKKEELVNSWRNIAKQNNS
jgi:sugar-specific transcriptional regulator TrmB